MSVNPNKERLKREFKYLKEKVEEAEKVRELRRGSNSWKNLRTLKKLKLNIKDKLAQLERWYGKKSKV